MATTTFDTLKFANTLKAAGVPDKQAEAQASILGDALAVNFKELATKDDLTATKDDLLAAIGSVRTDSQNDQRSLRTELQNDTRQTEQRLNAKIDSLDQRLIAKIDSLDQRLNAKIDSLDQRLNAKIDNYAAKSDGHFKLLHWMVGLSLSLNVTVLIRLFFFRGQ